MNFYLKLRMQSLAQLAQTTLYDWILQARVVLLNQRETECRERVIAAACKKEQMLQAQFMLYLTEQTLAQFQSRVDITLLVAHET